MTDDVDIDALKRDAERYRALRGIGAAPGGTIHLEDGLVFVATNLDRWVDEYLEVGLRPAPSHAREYGGRFGFETGRMDQFQIAVSRWMVECFGEVIAMDPLERIMRFLEEALELAQAEGMTEEEVGRVVSYVFGRAVGQTFQEVGGIMVTLAAFCFRRDVDLQAAALTEFRRIDSPEMRRRIFEKQAFKRAQGLTSDGGFRKGE